MKKYTRTYICSAEYFNTLDLVELDDLEYRQYINVYGEDYLELESIKFPEYRKELGEKYRNLKDYWPILEENPYMQKNFQNAVEEALEFARKGDDAAIKDFGVSHINDALKYITSCGVPIIQSEYALQMSSSSSMSICRCGKPQFTHDFSKCIIRDSNNKSQKELDEQYDEAKQALDEQIYAFNRIMDNDEEKKCECGAISVGSNKHSDYCGLYETT